MITKAALAELMRVYEDSRARWVEIFGEQFDEAAFHAWFTRQVAG